MGVIVQKIEKKLDSDLERAIKYYSLLSALNNLKFSPKQIELLAFAAVRGSITSPAARAEFVQLFDSSLASLENIKGVLVRRGWLVEVDKKYKINPSVNLDFSKDITIEVKLLTISDESKP